MPALADAELLELWERGQSRHPIDRALLLCARARPDLPAANFPELPLGAVNRALLRLRETCFGSAIHAYVDCEHCAERMELTLNTGQLLAGNDEKDQLTEFEIAKQRFRLPCSRDLAMISSEPDIEQATIKLLKQCCVSGLEATETEVTKLVAEAETIMAELDPDANINFDLTCENCGKTWLAEFNIGAILWDEIDVYARGLLRQVHTLASAYGWSETQILSLSRQRRLSYIDMVGI